MTPFEWRDDGFFRAPRYDKNLWVKGVGSDSEVVAELLRRAAVPEAPRAVYRARPNNEVRDWGWNARTGSDADDIGAELEYQLFAGRPQMMTAQLCAIAEGLPRCEIELREVARARTRLLNAGVPQPDSHRVFMPICDNTDFGAHGVPGSTTRGWAVWTDWIDPRLIVITPSRTWNDIDRHPRRRTVVRVAQWLHDAIESPSGIDAWLQKMFGNDLDPVVVKPIFGPAGPIYELVGGTHRGHAARIWELPAVLAKVVGDRLPIPIGPGLGGDMSQLWEGLRRRGLLEAQADEGRWLVQAVCAEWMLTLPALATKMNAAYARVYPGILQQATGMSTEELTQPARWKKALLKP